MNAVKKMSVLLLMLCPYAGMAQTDSTDINGGTLPEVNTKGMTTGGTVSSGVPLQSMNSDDFAAQGLNYVYDALRRFAGVSIRDYGGMGGMRTVSVRNMGASHTAVVYDGIVIGNTQAGQVDISRYKTYNLSMVSLAIGQSPSLLQSARQLAAGSVLEMESLSWRGQSPPKDKSFPPNGIGGGVQTGSFGLVEGTITWGQRLSEKTTANANISYLRADGTYPFTLKNGTLTTKEKRYNSDVWSISGETNLQHYFKDGSRMNVKAYYYNSERGLPGSVVLYNNHANERMWDENVFVQASYKRQIGQKATLVARAKYDYAYDKYKDIDVKYPTGMQRDVNRQNEYYAATTLHWEPTEHVEMAIAQDVFVNKLRNNIDEEPNPLRISSMTALSARFKYGVFEADGRVLATYVSENVEHGQHPRDRKRLCPMLSAKWKPLSERDMYVRIMAKNTYRLPSFNDMYYLRLGNRTLRPEVATEYNFGVTGTIWNGKRWTAKFTADAYYNEVKDKIVAFPTTYVWKMANFGHVQIYGLDITANSSIQLSQNINADFSITYSYQKATDKTERGSYSYGKQLPYTPENNGNTSVTLKTPWINVGYNCIAVGKRWSIVQTTDDYKLNAYTEHNITLSRSIALKKRTETQLSHITHKIHLPQLLLSLQLQNLFNTQYEIVKYYPMPGRSFMFTVLFSP